MKKILMIVFPGAVLSQEIPECAETTALIVYNAAQTGFGAICRIEEPPGVEPPDGTCYTFAVCEDKPEPAPPVLEVTQEEEP